MNELNLDWFALFRPFLVLAVMMAAMWEPKRRTKRKPKQDRKEKDNGLHEDRP